MFDLQEKERRDHETTWKKREELQKQLRDVHIRLRSGIDAIIQMIEARDTINEKLSEEELPSLSYRISADYVRVEVARSTPSEY
jgi:hypothetical protein